MSNFPNALDSDTDIPPINNNISEIGGDVINALRDAVFVTEQNIGLNAQGSTASISARLGVSLLPDGTIRASALTSLGLVTLPITQNQIAVNAGIPESKLSLDHKTQDLYNYITDLTSDVNTSIGWISSTGVKLEPHIAGALHRHNLDHINVHSNPVNYQLNHFRTPRNNTNAFTLIRDINDEFLSHQFADGSPVSGAANITTNNSSVFSSNYAHTSSGVFLNTSRFTVIPQTTQDLQSFAQFVNDTSIFLLGTRLQNLYSNGISKESRSSALSSDTNGIIIVPFTPAIAYLKNIGTSSNPFDDIDTGDDIIELKPASGLMSNNSFDSKFALVKIGDIIRINYGTVEVAFVIKEKKYIQDSGNKKYAVRIAGKNLQYAPNAIARIEKPLFNNNKYGVLAVAAANSGVSSIQSSLLVVNPRAAQTLGLGFNPDQLDNLHYLLYLALYPTGSPSDGYLILPPIDVTGNQGATPGLYTLNSVIEATNNAFRKVGYNYRFIAFQYHGEFGIALADSYKNTGFSILNAVVAPNGFLDELGTTIAFQNNVIGMFSSGGTPNDPLGLGPSGANVASPAFQTSYASAEASQNPTKIFLPLKRNNYYVNGTEREKVSLDVLQTLDGYGDGYWVGTINAKTIIPGPSPTGRVQTTYRIPLDLQASQLKAGKTLVVQGIDGYGSFPTDFGRFIIQSVSLGCCSPTNYTDITVYDAVHGTGVSPISALDVGSRVAIYFDSGSVSFNIESSTDFTSVSPFKRHFELYIDEDGKTFTHERGRINSGNISPLLINGSVPLVNYSELIKINILKISPKLRGYQFGSVNKITLNITNLSSTTGLYDGYLSSWDGNLLHAVTHKGPATIGKVGEITRFYDETNIDYIDIYFDVNTALSSFTNKKIDIQLFPTLSLDNQIMILGTFQYDDISNVISHVRDERQFGNVSEKEFSTSALSLISLPERLLHGNGVVKGFDLISSSNDQIYLTGGTVLVNGNLININNATVNIPIIKESYGSLYNVNWAICINSKGEYQTIPLLDFDINLLTPIDPQRIFTAFNIKNGQYYNLDASTFSDIINLRKDLTILYIAASTTVISPLSVSLSVSDSRRYIFDSDTNLPLKFTSSNAQGNFKNLTSIINWVKYNNLFNGNVIVKGANSTISEFVNFDFLNNVIIDGENSATLTFNGLVVFGSNITFKNLNLVFNGGIFANNKHSIQNLHFENCNITITQNSAIPTSNIFFDITGSNISIKNSVFNIQHNPLVSVPSPLTDITKYSGVFRLTNVNNFIVDKSTINVTFVTNLPTHVPGDLFILIDSDNVVIKDSIFSGNFNGFIRNNNSNNLSLNNLTVTSVFDPGSPLIAAFGFDYTNFVNSGQGYIYTNVNSTLKNVTIDSVTFNHSPVISDGYRFSFINFELSTPSSILSNLSITNCKFNSTNIGGLIEDRRPAISIINSYNGAPVAATSQQPILQNVNISKNICNRNQSIIITSRLDSNGKMNYPGLTAQNCIVSGNICGIIGYWIYSGNKIMQITSFDGVNSVNSLSDKWSNLIIENNLCHYIGNLDHNGKYFAVSNGYTPNTTVNNSMYPSGYVDIKNNKCNWIHVGIAFDKDSSLNISSNSLIAYIDRFHDHYGSHPFIDDDFNSVGSSASSAIFVSSNKHSTDTTSFISNDSSVIITNNIINAGYWLENNVPVIYNYGNGIWCQSSNIISNNIIKGFSYLGIVVGGLHNMITNNNIYRENKNIQSYVLFASGENPLWGGDSADGIHTTGFITHNFFDSPTIDGTNTTLINIPATATKLWITDRNIAYR